MTATGIPDVDGAVYADAEAAGVWVNSADDPAHCSFILPAVHHDGAVTVSVSTGGLSPALASWLRDRIAVHFDVGLGALAQLLGEARERLRTTGSSSDSVNWAALLDGQLATSCRQDNWTTHVQLWKPSPAVGLSSPFLAPQLRIRVQLR